MPIGLTSQPRSTHQARHHPGRDGLHPPLQRCQAPGHCSHRVRVTPTRAHPDQRILVARSSLYGVQHPFDPAESETISCRTKLLVRPVGHRERDQSPLPFLLEYRSSSVAHTKGFPEQSREFELLNDLDCAFTVRLGPAPHCELESPSESRGARCHRLRGRKHPRRRVAGIREAARNRPDPHGCSQPRRFDRESCRHEVAEVAPRAPVHSERGLADAQLGHLGTPSMEGLSTARGFTALPSPHVDKEHRLLSVVGVQPRLPIAVRRFLAHVPRSTEVPPLLDGVPRMPRSSRLILERCAKGVATCLSEECCHGRSVHPQTVGSRLISVKHTPPYSIVGAFSATPR